MKSLELIKEEVNVHGYSTIGKVLSADKVNWFAKNMQERKKADVEKYGEERLREKGYYDLIRGLIEIHKHYLELIQAQWLNALVNSLLDESATILDFYGVANTDCKNQSLARNKFHRDQPWIKDTRTSISIFIPLVDFTKQNGATLVVPGTHLFEQEPSDEFIDAHKVSLEIKAGDAAIIDAALLHSAGINLSGLPRPMMILRYHLAYMRQPLDLCQLYGEQIVDLPTLVKQRLGWNCRSTQTREEWLEEEKKWQSGQYSMKNTKIRL